MKVLINMCLPFHLKRWLSSILKCTCKTYSSGSRSNDFFIIIGFTEANISLGFGRDLQKSITSCESASTIWLNNMGVKEVLLIGVLNIVSTTTCCGKVIV